MTRNVVIYRESLLAPSETFIPAQGEGLRQFLAHYVGMRRIGGLTLPEPRTHVLNLNGAGPLAQFAFKFLGRLPRKTTEGIAALKPALVHAHFGTSMPEGMWLAHCLNVPLLITFHGYDVTEHGLHLVNSPQWWAAGLFRNIIRRRAARFVAVSDFIASRLVALGYPQQKIVRHYIGLDWNAFGEPCSLSQRTDTLLFVGRLVEKKGLIYLIDAAKRVQQHFPDMELVVIGDGPLREPLERQATATLRRTRFLGTQPAPVVREWMRKAKVLALPSVEARNGDAEGLGMVALESMAAGTPLVGFRHGGIPEAVAHGETGLLYPERDTTGLAEGIRALWEDAALWQRMSKAGRMRVRQHFDLSRQCALLETIYQDAIARGTEGHR